MMSCLKHIKKPEIISTMVLKKKFDKKPVYNQKFLKTKINSYEDKIITNFYYT